MQCVTLKTTAAYLPQLLPINHSHKVIDLAPKKTDESVMGKINSVCVLTAEDTQNVIAALPPQQAIYFQATVDTQNRTLDASTGNDYTITFPLPLPAQAFWSLTLYNATSLNLIVNPINRYTINDRVSYPIKI